MTLPFLKRRGKNWPGVGPGSNGHSKLPKLIGRIALPLALLAAWQLYAAHLNQPWMFPTPLKVAQILLHPMSDHFMQGSLVANTLVSMVRVLIGFIFAAVIGITLGLIMGSVRTVRTLLEPVIDNAGNPPHMIRLQDGRIALTYGYRHPKYGIRARISADNGQSWGDEIILRDDGAEWDLGYPRTVQRADGKIVTVYYFNDSTAPERYIEATIWDPGAK